MCQITAGLDTFFLLSLFVVFHVIFKILSSVKIVEFMYHTMIWQKCSKIELCRILHVIACKLLFVFFLPHGW